jgi:hypothetical protein
MSEVLRRTWLPTLLLGVPIFFFELIGPGQLNAPLSSWTFYALVAVPTVWWLTTAKDGHVSVGRGAASGALCGAGIVLIPAIIELFRVAVIQKDGSGGLVGVAWNFYLMIVAAILVPLGAGIGAVTALLQRPGRAKPS